MILGNGQDDAPADLLQLPVDPVTVQSGLAGPGGSSRVYRSAACLRRLTGG